MESPKRRKRRSKEDIEEMILETATRLIIEKGFSGVTVTAIMQEAQIEPVQFYHRYNDLSHFIGEYVKKYDYWLSDIIDNSKKIANDKEEYKTILNNLFKSLCENKVMQQLLRWELSNNNEISRRTARLREVHTMPLVEKFDKKFSNSSIDVVALSSLLIGGMYYLILHSDISVFSGIDIKSPEGKQRIHDAINYTTEVLFSKMKEHDIAYEIACKMKQNGIDNNIIAKCTNLSETDIQKI